MRRRIAATAALFAIATIATAVMGSWLPTPFRGPIAAAIVAALGAMIIGLAPQAEVKVEVEEALELSGERRVAHDSMSMPIVSQLPQQPANQPEPGAG